MDIRRSLLSCAAFLSVACGCARHAAPVSQPALTPENKQFTAALITLPPAARGNYIRAHRADLTRIQRDPAQSAAFRKAVATRRAR